MHPGLHLFARLLLAVGLVAATTLVGPAAPTPVRAPVAAAFELAAHEQVVRQALGSLVAPDALEKIVAGNEGSDLHQFSPERHFDSADGPQAICDRFRAGMLPFLSDAVHASGPGDARATRLVNRDQALKHFGELSHAIQDFYAHSNWIELQFAAGRSPQVAPIVAMDCDPAKFPADLQTGYFDLQHGLDGCPNNAGLSAPEPPAPFTYCHEQIAKDHPDDGHGAELAPDGFTYHSIAFALATQSTVDAWELLHDQIVATWTTDTLDGECLFQKLAFGGDEPCRCGPGGSLPGRLTLVRPGADGALVAASVAAQPLVCVPPEGSITYSEVSTWPSTEQTSTSPSGSTLTTYVETRSATDVSIALTSNRATATVSQSGRSEHGARSSGCWNGRWARGSESQFGGTVEARVSVSMDLDGAYRIHVFVPSVPGTVREYQTFEGPSTDCRGFAVDPEAFGITPGTISDSSPAESGSLSFDLDGHADPAATSLTGSQQLFSLGTATATYNLRAGNYTTDRDRDPGPDDFDDFEDFDE